MSALGWLDEQREYVSALRGLNADTPVNKEIMAFEVQRKFTESLEIRNFDFMESGFHPLNAL